MRRWQLWAMSAVLLCALVGLVLAQEGGAGAPAGGGRRARGGDMGGMGFGGRGGGPMTEEQRTAMVQRQVDNLKEALAATDEEWAALQDPITAVVNLSGDEMKARQDLRTVVSKEGVTNDELKAALETYRKTAKDNLAKREKAEAALKGILTVKQEATLVLRGTLN